MNSILAIVLVSVLAVLLWRESHKKTPLILPVGSDEWIILASYTIKNAGDALKAAWDPDAPIILEFVPIIGWEFGETGLTPLTPRSYQLSDRVSANRFDKDAKCETLGFCIRDGVVFNMADMSHSGFWTGMYDHASCGHEIEIRGMVPDQYRSKFAEIIAESERQRSERRNQETVDA